MSFNSRLKAIRLNMGLNQKEFADKIGISPVTLSHYENDKREPDLKKLASICTILSVSSDYMLGLSDSTSPAMTVTISSERIPRDPLDDLSPDRREKVCEFIEFQRLQQAKEEQTIRQEA